MTNAERNTGNKISRFSLDCCVPLSCIDTLGDHDAVKFAPKNNQPNAGTRMCQQILYHAVCPGTSGAVADGRHRTVRTDIGEAPSLLILFWTAAYCVHDITVQYIFVALHGSTVVNG